MKKLNEEKLVKAPKSHRLLILAGLLVASFMSTSYAASDDSGPNCAASYIELARHREAGGKCSPANLKARLNGLTGHKWIGPFENTVVFKSVRDSENFHLLLNGQQKFGKICCRGGEWTIGGYKVGVPQKRTLQIGSFVFRSEEHSMVRQPVQFAELQSSGQGGRH